MFFIYVFSSYKRVARTIISSKDGPQNIEKNASITDAGWSKRKTC